MKRGLISWEASELPPAELTARLAAVHTLMRDEAIEALVLYSDVWRSNDVRYLSNYMPYWNRAFAVVPRDEKPVLLCSLSPRVYPWIKSVTVHETIVPSPNLPAALFKLCTERGWTRIGICDLDGLPADLYGQLTAGKLDLVDIPRSEIRAAPSEIEVQMHARAAHLAREVLQTELATANGVSDHELTGRIERLLRRAGAEDVVVLVANGKGPPVPASGAIVSKHTSVVVAVEYKGHWAKVTRNVAGVTARMAGADAVTELREILSGPYSWHSTDAPDEQETSAVVALQRKIGADNQQLYYGDTCLQSREGLRIL